MFVENGQRALRPPFEKFQHCRLAEWLGKVTNEAIGTEIAADLLIVENDPAQRFQSLVLAAREEPPRALSEVKKDHTRLAQLLAAVSEHWRFAHLVDLLTVFRCALNASFEEIDVHRLPVRPDCVEHQRCAVAVA